MAATDDFFRSQYAGLRKFAGTMGDKIGFGAKGGAESVFDPAFQEELRNSNARVRSANNPGIDSPETARRVAQMESIGSERTAPRGERVRGPTAMSFRGEPNKKGFLRRAGANVVRGARGLAKAVPALAGPAVIGLEGVNAVGNIQAGENPVASAGRAAIRSGATLLGGTGGAALGTLAAPGVGTVAGGVAGGVAGYEAGDYAAGKLFGPEPDPVADMMSGKTVVSGDAARINPAAAAAAAPAAEAAPGGIPTQNIGPDGVTRGAPQTPQGLIDGSGVPVRGTGAFQVTGADGQVHPAQGVDLRSQQVQAPQAYESAQAHDDRLFGPKEGGNPVPNAQPGVFGEIAAMAGLRSRHAAARIAQSQGNRNADRAVKIRGQDTVAAAAGTRNSIAAAKELRARGDATRAVNNSTIEDQARQSIDPGLGDEYEPAVKQLTAQMKSAYRFSLSDRKGESRMSLADAPPAELSRLKVLWDVKQRQKKGDTKFWEGMKDLIGTKRFESRNLYDSMPVAISKGRVLHADGNETEASRVLNNLLNFITPNDPADVQVQDMLRKLPTIEDYNAKNAKKGR